MNITDKVLRYAESKGLEGISTGGGCDYVYRKVGIHDVIVASKTDPTSPETLGESCDVIIFDNDNWDDGLYIPFKTTRKGIDFVSRMNSMQERLEGN